MSTPADLSLVAKQFLYCKKKTLTKTTLWQQIEAIVLLFINHITRIYIFHALFEF